MREREHLQARAADADRARTLQRNLSQSSARRASLAISLACVYLSTDGLCRACIGCSGMACSILDNPVPELWMDVHWLQYLSHVAQGRQGIHKQLLALCRQQELEFEVRKHKADMELLELQKSAAPAQHAAPPAAEGASSSEDADKLRQQLSAAQAEAERLRRRLLDQARPWCNRIGACMQHASAGAAVNA